MLHVLVDYVTTLWRPILEILIFWYVIYRILVFIQGTRTVQVLTGLSILLIISIFTKWFGLTSINWVLTNFFAIGVLALVVIFQPELRRALAGIGQNTAFRILVKRGGIIDEIVKACDEMSRDKIGALFAIERNVGLRNYIETGVPIDATVQSDLLRTIFNPRASLHDGAVIISNNRVASCASLFPLSQNTEIKKTLGTRHRAAIGLTEETDAIAIVVSEETGNISVSVYGKFTKNLDEAGLRRVLLSLLKPNEKPKSFLDLIRGANAKNQKK